MSDLHSLGTLSARVALDTSPLAAGVRAAALGFEAIAAAAASVGVVSVKMASDFQASMEKLHTQAGVSQGQIKELSNSVLDLAGKVGTSPDSLAQALFHVESTFQSTGKSGKEMMDILRVGAEGARIGGSNLVDTQNALDAAIVSGISGAENLQSAMGLLNATVGVGDMTMQDLAEALGSGVIPVVKNYGLTLRDVGATLAVFGDNNIRGAQAGTALRMAVQALAVPVKGGAAALKEMGLTTKSLAEDMQKGGILPALEDLKAHMDAAGITGDAVGQKLTEIFGKRAGTGVAVLMNSLDLLKSKFPELDQQAGNFGDAWDQTSQTMKQRLADVKASLDAMFIRLGSFLIPYVLKGLDELQLGFAAMRAAFSGQGPVTDSGFVAAMERIGITARNLVTDVEDAWPRIWKSIKQYGELLGPILAGVRDAIRDAAPIAAGLALAIEAIGRVASEHKDAVRLLAEAIAGLAIANGIAGAISAAATAVGLLAAPAIAVAGAVTSATASLWAFVTGAGAATVATSSFAVAQSEAAAAANGFAASTAGATAASDGFAASAGAAGAAAAGAGLSIGGAVAAAGLLSGALLLASRFADEHVSALRRVDETVVGWERHLPGVGDALAALDSKVLGLGRNLDSLHAPPPIKVDVDTYQASQNLADLKSQLASLNAQIAQSGGGGGLGLARNATQAAIDRSQQDAGNNAGDNASGDSGTPSGGGSEAIDHEATGGVIARAMGGLRKAASGLAMLAPGGGRPHGPTLVSEGGYDEFVITPDPLYRLRNTGLLAQANQALGSPLGQGGAAPIDYQALAAAIAPALAAAVAANPVRATINANDVLVGTYASGRSRR